MELEPGVEGLVHVSEMSWTKKNVHPGKIVSTSQEVEVVVLDVDASKRRISLGLKQAHAPTPGKRSWKSIRSAPIVEGEIKNITEFGLFVGLSGGNRRHGPHVRHRPGTMPAKTPSPSTRRATWSRRKCSTSTSRRSASRLGIKQLEVDPAAGVLDKIHKGQIVTCVVTAVQANGIEVKVDDVLTGFIRRAELARDKGEQRTERFSVGDSVDAKITAVDRAARKLQLTIKGKEIDEDKTAVAEFGSSDSGASLGDILGAAIRRRNQSTED